MDKFNNQFATQKLRQEMSVTSGGAGMTPSTVNNPVTQDWYTTKNKKKPKKEEKDVEPKLAAGKAKVYMKDKWGWKDAPSIPNRPSKGGFIYKQLFEELSDFVKQNQIKEEVKYTISDTRRYIMGMRDLGTEIQNFKERDKLINLQKKLDSQSDLIAKLAILDSMEKIVGEDDTVHNTTKKDALEYIEIIRNLHEPEEQGDDESEYDWFTDEPVSDYGKYRKDPDYYEKDYQEKGTGDYFQRRGLGEIEHEDKKRGFKVGDKVKHENQDWTIERILDNGGYRLKHSKGLPSVNVGAGDLKRQNKLNENYSKFKNETKTRGKSDQFHQAIRAVRKKVQEINKLFEYVSRLKSELSEGEDGLRYKEHTQKALAKIKEMVSELNQNIKKFK